MPQSDKRSDELPGMLAVAKGIAEQRWPHTMDAKVWADEFLKLNPGSDHGLMLGWFANAIMAGYDTAQARASSPSAARSTNAAPQAAETQLKGTAVNLPELRDRLDSSGPSGAAEHRDGAETPKTGLIADQADVSRPAVAAPPSSERAPKEIIDPPGAAVEMFRKRYGRLPNRVGDQLDLADRLELAAQACHAAHLLSCEATCREAVVALSAIRATNQGEVMPEESSIEERLQHEIAKYQQVRGSQPIGINERLLADALEEIQRLRNVVGAPDDVG